MATNTQRPGSEIDLTFVRDAIAQAVTTIEEQMYRLPEQPEEARLVVQNALEGLRLTAGATRLHCGPSWFFLPR
jgi:hypothetical protein